MSEQQLGDTSAAPARAQVANLQARLERMDAVRQSYQQEYSKDQPGLPGGENSEAMSNFISSSLGSIRPDQPGDRLAACAMRGWRGEKYATRSGHTPVHCR
jgi:hypothetical protein